jgi:hypothetical protein
MSYAPLDLPDAVEFPAGAIGRFRCARLALPCLFSDRCRFRASGRTVSSAAMDDRKRLLEKLRRIEALYIGGSTDGERSAAEAARGRVQARLLELKQTDPPIEYQFTTASAFSYRLLIALLRRYGIRPYRYPRQRRTTVLARVSRSFVDGTLWPEYEALNRALHEHLDRITTAIIEEAIAKDTSDAEEVRGSFGPA